MNARTNARAILVLAMGLSTLAIMGANCLPGEATVTVAGMVTAAADGAALDGIEVTCKATVNGEEISATVTSGEAAEGETEDAGAAEPGSYRCELEVPALEAAADEEEADDADAGVAEDGGAAEEEEGDGAETIEVEVSFADVDGEENGGSFAAKSETVEVEIDGEATLDAALDAEG